MVNEAMNLALEGMQSYQGDRLESGGEINLEEEIKALKQVIQTYSEKHNFQQDQDEHYKGVIEGVQKLFDEKRKAKQEQGEPKTDTEQINRGCWHKTNLITTQPKQEQDEHYKGVIEGVQKLFDDKRKAKQEQGEPVAKGMALVPKHMTQAMRDVTDQEDWTWEDLLAAAETITEDEYNEIANQPTLKPKQEQGEPVARIKEIDEYGPLLEWYEHWIKLPIGTKFYTTPQQRKPLTDSELHEFWNNDQSCYCPDTSKQFKYSARLIEAAHGIKE